MVASVIAYCMICSMFLTKVDPTMNFPKGPGSKYLLSKQYVHIALAKNTFDNPRPGLCRIPMSLHKLKFHIWEVKLKSQGEF